MAAAQPNVSMKAYVILWMVGHVSYLTLVFGSVRQFRQLRWDN